MSNCSCRYDRYRGVISLVSVRSGVLRKGDRISSHHTKKKYEVVEVGIMNPEEVPTPSLRPGQVGYVGEFTTHINVAVKVDHSLTTCTRSV